MTTQPKRGLNIVIEGGDACGKHTQTKLLGELLQDRGVPCWLYSFPRYATSVGTTMSRFLRREMTVQASPELSLTDEEKHQVDGEIFQALAFYDRCAGYLEMEKFLREGGNVVCDRLWPSSLYGKVAAGLPSSSLFDEGFFMPADLYLLLDLPAKEAVSRRPVARDKYEEKLSLRQGVRAAYLELWLQKIDEEGRDADMPLPRGRWHVVDARPSIDEVASEISKIVIPFMENRQT